jgi:uncharacterized phage-like protein YoqJ
MTIAVIGHRPDKLGKEYDMRGPTSRKIYNSLDLLVTELRPRKMISGMALGVDMIFANLAINKGIDLVCAVPFEGQEMKWNQNSRKVYNAILRRSKEVRVICGVGYAPWKMQKRNEWMVNNSDMLIAVWDVTEGGTWNCVNYAVDKGREIRRIDPKSL